MASNSDECEIIYEEMLTDDAVPLRRDIREIISNRDISKQSKEAAAAERERLKRIKTNQKFYKELIESRGTTGSVELVLEFNRKTRQPLVEVNKTLVKFLKPHQKTGVQFMYNCVIESVDQLKSSKGSGCILAHSMGLGKTLQAVTFLYTVLTHTDIKKTVKRALVIAPVNTIKNWANEFNVWLVDHHLTDLLVYEISDVKTPEKRAQLLNMWFSSGGVMIIGLTLFSSLVMGRSGKKPAKSVSDAIQKCLLSPGPDIVVCDEGHLLKNEETSCNKAVSQIKTIRRIVLTGTPLQNNLAEYHVMVHFVKPYLLGTKSEFNNRFVNPITNGQHEDSTDYDVNTMKKRVHILHKLLDGCVHRCDYNILVPYLQPKYEYVLSVMLTDKQIELYSYYLKNLVDNRKHNLFRDYSALRLIWNHPILLYEQQRRRYLNTETDSAEDVRDSWFEPLLKEEESHCIELSGKFILLFAILDECQKFGDKILLFSQSLDTLDLIEEMLSIRTVQSYEQSFNSGSSDVDMTDSSQVWIKNQDYFRLDGSTSADYRKKWIDQFNDEDNLKGRMFLISTKAGGLGINLIGANRCVIFDASWNPTHDVQAIFRVFRLGQKKPVFIYRFVAQGSMEEKIYERQIAKQSLSGRVVDEKSIQRHFKARELRQLYVFEPNTSKDRPTHKLPKDRLLANLLLNHKDYIVKYHEHDSLLENKPEEEMTENEKLVAWNEYEEERGQLNLSLQIEQVLTID